MTGSALATTTIDDGVAVITMDDGKANAISHAMLDVLEPALDAAEENGHAVVLAGRKGLFCAGFDLKTMQGGTPADIAYLVTRGGKLALRLFSFPRPVVAACTGHAYALGAIWLLACDTRVGTAGEFGISMNETAIGMVLPHFGYELGRQRLAPQHLTAAAIQAKVYAPEEAVAAGYLDEVAGDGAAVARATQIARTLGALPAHAYAGNKEAIRADAIESIRHHLSHPSG